MRQSIKTWISFGITSGIITTLGLMVGLTSWTGSVMVVIGGILTIAVADAFSDALGIHLSQESNAKNSDGDVWKSTISTFIAKLIFASTFIVPILIFSLKTWVFVNIFRGLCVLILLTARIARQNKENVMNAILQHLSIAVVVIIATYYIGIGIANIFWT